MKAKSSLTGGKNEKNDINALQSVGYDWHRGHENNDPNTKPQIVLRNVVDEFKPKRTGS